MSRPLIGTSKQHYELRFAEIVVKLNSLTFCPYSGNILGWFEKI